MKLFITGASGYVGGLLVEHFVQQDDVAEIIALDRRREPTWSKKHAKVTWIKANTVDETWQEVVAQRQPTVVIHCAWEIREFYFKKKQHRHWNIDGSKNVFDFAFTTPSVRKIVYLSSVAAYGAFPDNSADMPLVETKPLREDEYLYGIQKKQSEEDLLEIYHRARQAAHAGSTSANTPSSVVLRVSSLTGPRYSTAKKGMTLQNVLTRIPFIPVANPQWGRQFVQEDDLLAIIGRIIAKDAPGSYRVFNVAPQKFMNAAEIVAAYGKHALSIPKEFLRISFFIFRHLSLGRLPTSKGGWKFYAFPLVVDGGAIGREYDFQYSSNRVSL